MAPTYTPARNVGATFDFIIMSMEPPRHTNIMVRNIYYHYTSDGLARFGAIYLDDETTAKVILITSRLDIIKGLHAGTSQSEHPAYMVTLYKSHKAQLPAF